MAPLAYLRIALDGIKPRTGVKHLLIDEMQDYTPVQYRVIQRLFPCRKTLLGDAEQSVNPYGSSSAETIARVFLGAKVMRLCKSYRSTFEITEFAQRIRRDDELEPIARHGEASLVLRLVSVEAELAGIARLIAEFRHSAHSSLGIVCKTETQVAALHERLCEWLRAETAARMGHYKGEEKDADSGNDGADYGGDGDSEDYSSNGSSDGGGVYYDSGTDGGSSDIFLLTSRSSTFAHGVVVTSAHMAKGLEFDEVIIPHVDNANYHTDIDRAMLYVAATRAMHRLTLTYSEIPSGFFHPANIEHRNSERRMKSD